MDSDVTEAVAGVLATARNAAADPAELLSALVALRQVQGVLAAVEPELIRAARAAGASWQQLAPALGVASRQAAERRYLRLVPAPPDDRTGTRDGRVRAERDRRAVHRAVEQWANDHTAGLRQLAGQVTALTNLGHAATDDIDRLHAALAHADATALPSLLAGTQRHLGEHPELADQIDELTAQTDRVRRQTQLERDGSGPAD